MKTSGTRRNPSRVSAALRTLRIGLFGALFIMSKKASEPHAIRTYIDFAVRLVQMFGFLLSDKFEFLSTWYLEVLFATVFYLAFTWVVLLLGLLLYSMVAYVNNSFPVLWPLRLLRVMGSLSASVLFIPLLQMLLSPFQCTAAVAVHPYWRAAYPGCVGPGLVAIQALSALLALALVLLALLFGVIFFESNSLSRGLAARAHGRVDLIMLCVQTTLVMTTQTFVSQVPVPVVITVMFVAGALWLGCFVFFLPFYAHGINQLNAAGAAAFLWGCVCLVLNNYNRDSDAAIMLFFGVPVAALAGVQIANWRASGVLARPPAHLTNEYEVELKARYILHTAVWGHPTQRRSAADVGFMYGLSGIGLRYGGGATAPATARLGGTLRNGGGDAATVAFAADDPYQGGAAAVAASRVADDVAEALEDGDGDGRHAALRRLVSPAVVADVQALYRSAAGRMRSSSMLHAFCARFYAAYLGNKHMQFSHLNQAERRSPPLDVSYLCFQARKLAEDGVGGGAQLSAIHRVTFDKYAADARRQVQAAASKQLAFWAELMDACPDLGRLHQLSTETNAAIHAAENCFAELFALNAQSLPVLRLAAAFHEHVTCNAEKAGALTGEADRLEDQKSKDHRAEGSGRLQIMAESPLDVWSDSAAVLTVSAASRDLGVIISANAATTKLCGYSRLQLERRSAFSLLPQVLAEFHEEALRGYLNTGEGAIVDYTRISFALHKAGHILPVLSCVRDAPANEGPPTFLWIMRELPPTFQYALLDADLAVLALSAGSMELLGVDAAALAGREVSLHDYVLELTAPGVLEDLRSPAGTTLLVNPPPRSADKHQGAAAGDDASDGAGSEGSAADSTGAGSEGGSPAAASEPSARRGTTMSPYSTRTPQHRSTGGASMKSPFQQQQQSGRRSAAGTPVPQIAGIIVGEPSGPSWVRAQLQTVAIEGLDEELLVLAWSRISESERLQVDRARARRDAALMLLQQQGRAPPRGSSGAGSVVVTADQLSVPAADTSRGASRGGTARKRGGGSVRLREPTGRSERSAAAPVGSRSRGEPGSSEESAVGGSPRQPPPRQSEAPPAAAHGESRIQIVDRLLFQLPGQPERERDGSADGAASMPQGAPRKMLLAADDASAPSPVVVADADTEAPASETPQAARLPTEGPVTAGVQPSGATGVSFDEGAAAETSDLEQQEQSRRANWRRDSDADAGEGGGGGGRHSPRDPRNAVPLVGVLSAKRQPASGAARQAVRRSVAPGGGSALRFVHSGDDDNDDDAGTPAAAAAASVGDAAHIRSQGPNRVAGVPGSAGNAVAGAGVAASGDHNEDGQSRDSGETDATSRTSATTRSMARLRRLLQDPNPPLLRGLQLLLWAGLLVTVLGLALAATVVVVSRTSFTSYSNNVEYVAQGVQRLAAMAGCVLAMQQLVAIAHGWSPSSVSEESGYREQMRSNAAAFTAAHNAMYELVQGTTMSAVYTDAYITITRWDMPPNGVYNQYQVLNLAQTGNLFASTMLQMSTDNITNYGLVTGYPSLQLIDYDYMRFGNGHETLQLSMLAGYENTVASTQSVRTTQITVYVVMLLVVFIIGGGVFVPILYFTEASSDTIMLQFVALPLPVRRSMYAQAVGRVRLIRRNYAEDDDSDDDNGSDVEDDEEAAVGVGFGGRMSARVSPEGAAADGSQPPLTLITDATAGADVNNVNWDSVLGASAPAAIASGRRLGPSARTLDSLDGPSATGAAGGGATAFGVPSDSVSDAGGSVAGGKLRSATVRGLAYVRRSLSVSQRQRTYRKSGRNYACMLGRFLSPLTSLVIMFSVVFGVFVSSLSSVLTLSSVTLAANMRAACSRQATVDLIKLAFQTVDPDYSSNVFWYTMDGLNCVKAHVTLLAYAATPAILASPHWPYAPYTPAVENGQPSVLSAATTATVYQAMFANACPFLATVSPLGAAFNITDCEAFAGGLLQQGMVALVTAWWQGAYNLGDRQLRSGFWKGTDPRFGAANVSYLFEGYGWLEPAATFNYNSSLCALPTCNLELSFAKPADGSALPPTVLPESSYVGDFDPPPAPPPSAGSTLYRIQNELASAGAIFVDEATTLYLTPGLQGIAALYQAETTAALNSCLLFLIVFVPTYMAVFLAAMVFYFVPRVRAVNRDIQTKRGMLLYLPLAVVTRIRSIRLLVASIIGSADAASGAAGTHNVAASAISSKSLGRSSSGAF